MNNNKICPILSKQNAYYYCNNKCAFYMTYINSLDIAVSSCALVEIAKSLSSLNRNVESLVYSKVQI